MRLGPITDVAGVFVIFIFPTLRKGNCVISREGSAWYYNLGRFHLKWAARKRRAMIEMKQQAVASVMLLVK